MHVNKRIPKFVVLSFLICFIYSVFVAAVIIIFAKINPCCFFAFIKVSLNLVCFSLRWTNAFETELSEPFVPPFVCLSESYCRHKLLL
jgi:hypothetical protein